jgi:hypothetical protein
MAEKVAPPPIPPPNLADPQAAAYLRQLHQWSLTVYRKLGEASNTAPISVSGTSTTITEPLPSTQLTGRFLSRWVVRERQTLRQQRLTSAFNRSSRRAVLDLYQYQTVWTLRLAISREQT